VPNVNGKVVAVMARQDQQPLAADALEQMKQFNTSAGDLQPVTYNVEKIGSTTAVGRPDSGLPTIQILSRRHNNPNHRSRYQRGTRQD
jgi:hypothetical protein